MKNTKLLDSDDETRVVVQCATPSRTARVCELVAVTGEGKRVDWIDRGERVPEGVDSVVEVVCDDPGTARLFRRILQRR